MVSSFEVQMADRGAVALPIFMVCFLLSSFPPSPSFPLLPASFPRRRESRASALEKRRCAARPLGWIPAFAGMTCLQRDALGVSYQAADGTNLKS
jgi:hypothetical protein